MNRERSANQVVVYMIVALLIVLAVTFVIHETVGPLI